MNTANVLQFKDFQKKTLAAVICYHCEVVYRLEVYEKDLTSYRNGSKKHICKDCGRLAEVYC